ncbi:hypothetical protein D3C81_1534200 [compost metagenome]
MQFERLALGMQGVGHGDHRGDPDATAQQDRSCGIASQREQVARRADAHRCAGLQLLVHGHRAAAGLRVLEHAKAVDIGLRGVAAQRILPHQVGR